jgi:hypothetical protein
MDLWGILWVFFRVLLVGFGLFGPGTARAPVIYNSLDFIVNCYLY